MTVRSTAPVSGPHEDDPDRLMFSDSMRRHGGRPRAPRESVDETAMFAALEDAYPFGRWRSWHATERGASNLSWFVSTDAGDVVLRRSHPLKSLAAAEFECGLIDLLCARGFPAPAVQRARDGGSLVEIDGVIHMVTRRLPGTGYDGDSALHLAAAARGLGWYHDIVSELLARPTPDGSFGLARLGPTGQQTLRAAVEVVAPLLEPSARGTTRDSARFLGAEMARLHEALGNVQDRLTRLVVHGSYEATSLLVDGDRLSAVLDFDRAAFDLIGFDLAYALDAFCRTGPVRRTGVGLDVHRARDFLEHYCARTPLPDADRRALPQLMRVQRVLKVLSKCDNVLMVAPPAVQHGQRLARFARALDRERARVEWLRDNLTTVAEEA